MAINKCPNCGAKVKFDPDTGLMVCEHCGYRQTKNDEVKPTSQPATQSEFQPQPQNKATVLYDQNGNPVFVQSIQTNQNMPNGQTNSQPVKTKRVGPFVASIVTLVLSLVFLGLSILFFAQFVGSGHNSADSILLFFVYIFTGLGLVTFLPAMGLSIAALVCSCLSIKSCVKAIKIISIITVVFATIAVVASVALPFFLPSFFEAASSSSSTATSIML